jgi:hypothetical protein
MMTSREFEYLLTPNELREEHELKDTKSDLELYLEVLGWIEKLISGLLAPLVNP